MLGSIPFQLITFPQTVSDSWSVVFLNCFHSVVPSFILVLRNSSIGIPIPPETSTHRERKVDKLNQRETRETFWFSLLHLSSYFVQSVSLLVVASSVLDFLFSRLLKIDGMKNVLVPSSNSCRV